ncbi:MULTISPECIES: DUF397 domain-containing protein [unclassified Saccharopolyspora]|uniref:DUF397 domain-containing protein n=1 Tax=Saccharopolyspora TaxID=1835 RepID=UPI0025D173FB|nr:MULTISPECIES: DUF397 domain-containing protein [unclassified Saccharopolyspora]
MDPLKIDWKRSSRSMNQGACVEVAALPSAVLARDSKDPHGPILRFDRRRWTSFLTHLAAAEQPARSE